MAGRESLGSCDFSRPSRLDLRQRLGVPAGFPQARNRNIACRIRDCRDIEWVWPTSFCRRGDNADCPFRKTSHRWHLTAAGVFLGVISLGAVIVMAARLVCRLVEGRTEESRAWVRTMPPNTHSTIGTCRDRRWRDCGQNINLILDWSGSQELDSIVLSPYLKSGRI